MLIDLVSLDTRSIFSDTLSFWSHDDVKADADDQGNIPTLRMENISFRRWFRDLSPSHLTLPER